MGCVYATKHGRSNMQVLLRYTFVCLKMQCSGSWGFKLDWVTLPIHKVFLGSNTWSHVGKTWHNMAKKLVQELTMNLIGILSSNIRWTWGMNMNWCRFFLIPWIRIFKWFQCVNEVWHAKDVHFITWEEAMFIFPLNTRTLGNGDSSWRTLRMNGIKFLMWKRKSLVLGHRMSSIGLACNICALSQGALINHPFLVAARLHLFCQY